jgi:hypothetical protein
VVEGCWGGGEDEFGHAAPVLEHNNTGNLHMLELQQPLSSMGMLLHYKDSILNCACVSFKQKQNILSNWSELT